MRKVGARLKSSPLLDDVDVPQIKEVSVAAPLDFTRPHACPAATSDDAKEFAGILLEDQRADFIPDRDLFQIPHPAIGSD